MKQLLIDAMTAMMPLMKPLVWLSGIALVAGLALMLIGGPGWRRWASIAGNVMLGTGLFFLAAQGMGALLGASPSINFGDSAKFQFELVPFWKLGMASIVAGILVRLMARVRARR